MRTLAHLTGVPEHELDQTLEEAVRLGVVTRRNVSPGEDCRFYHTIIRRIVYDRISAGGRVRLHAAAAGALEAVYAADRHRIAEAASITEPRQLDPVRTVVS